jgi:hypothetical protein
MEMLNELPWNKICVLNYAGNWKICCIEQLDWTSGAGMVNLLQYYSIFLTPLLYLL